MFRVEETQWAQAQKPEAPSVQRNKGADTGNGCGSHFMGGGLEHQTKCHSKTPVFPKSL